MNWHLFSALAFLMTVIVILVVGSARAHFREEEARNRRMDDLMRSQKDSETLK